ncbi:MAG: tetratricopeptide repeat protein [Chloroflexi bacterium]|nr:tetratricopeptide repeat protein [Chloroflexota bacterium]
MSRAWSNAGMLFLNRALEASSQDSTASSNASSAEAMLRHATVLSPQNWVAWRGLGFALATQGRENEAIGAWRMSGVMDQVTILAASLDLVRQGRDSSAVVLWKNAGNMSQLLRSPEERELNLEQYGDVRWWYEFATVMEPDLGDAWHYLGLVYVRTGQVEKSLAAYKRATESKVFRAIGRSSSYCSMGMVFGWSMSPQQLDLALQAFDTAIRLRDFSTDLEAARCHEGRGEVLLWQNANPGEYLIEFQQALELNPDFAYAHLMLGVAYFNRYQDVALAATEIHKAIELDPQDKWIYYHAGVIYQKAGRIDDSIVMFERALVIDPGLEKARQMLATLRD